MNKLKWNLHQNSYIFIQENAFENAVCKMGGHFVWASLHPRRCGSDFKSVISAHASDYRKTSNIRRTLVDNKIVDHSDVLILFILDSTSRFKGFDKDSRKTVRESFKCWGLVRLILETWRYVFVSTSCEIASRWMLQNISDDKTTLVQVMAWCRQATSYYLNQFWPRSMSPYGVIRPQWVNVIFDSQRPYI